VEDSKLVKAKTVKECAKELELPQHSLPAAPAKRGRAASNEPTQLVQAGKGGEKRRRWLLYAGVATPLVAGMAVAVIHPPDGQTFREVREVITGFGPAVHNQAGWSVKIEDEGASLSPPEQQEAGAKPLQAPAEPETPPIDEQQNLAVTEAIPEQKTAKIIEEPLLEEPLPMMNSAAAGSEPPPLAVAGSQLPLSLVINFEVNSDRASKGAYQELERLATIMHENPEMQAMAIGYSDTSGFYQYNLMISSSRADMVKGFLVGQGIEPHRIRTMGRGPEHPVASNETEEGRRLNRRVEIHLVRGN
jgi:outer membrane protein OmpA-like peptidoglycan-associated protein